LTGDRTAHALVTDADRRNTMALVAITMAKGRSLDHLFDLVEQLPEPLG